MYAGGILAKHARDRGTTSGRSRKVKVWHPYRRLLVGCAIVLGVNLALALGYWALNLDRTNPDGTPIGFVQCLYMTVISTFTVGYGEFVPVLTSLDRFYTMLVIVSGIAMIGYGLSQLTSFVVEGELKEMWERRTMERLIGAMRNHYIVCGLGETGHYAVNELVQTRRPLIAIDSDEARLKKLAIVQEFPYVVGDATDEIVLEQAGIRAALGVMCALPNDRDNLFLAMTCRQLNPKLRIVTKAEDVNLAPRVRNAGADAVISPQFIGGLRMVSELVRPTVVTFLDRMLRGREMSYRVEEIRIDPNGSMSGKRLCDLQLAQWRIVVVAVQAPGSEHFEHAPLPETVLLPGSTLVVIGEAEPLARARAAAAPAS